MMASKLACFHVLVIAALIAAPLAARAQDEGPVVTPSTEPPPGGAPAESTAPPAPPAPAPVAPIAPPAQAPPYPPPPYRVPPPVPAPAGPVHSGFLLRLHLGFGFISLTGSGTNVPTTKIAGHGLAIGVALGGKVAENMAVFGNFFETVAEQPDITTGGIDGGNTSGSAGLVGFGCGAVYYFEPINLYVSGSLAIMSVGQQDKQGNDVDPSTPGYGLEAMVGKEWWVSQHWGLGVSAQLVLATGMRDENDTRIGWSGEGASFLFSATYF